MSRVHVIGAGLAGLSTAVTLARAGHHVVVSEASNQAGGRCRSYHDPQLDTVIDNGNHLLLSGNHAAFAYLEAIGATDKLKGPDRALFPFVDLEDGTRWTLQPNDGTMPWWILKGSQRVPGTKLGDYMHARALLKPEKGATVGETYAAKGMLWRRLIEPFLIATLNTPPAEASAKLARAVLRETLLKGGRAIKPRIASPTLSAAFVDPALAALAKAGAEVRFGRRLRAIGFESGRAVSLAFGDTKDLVAPGEAVVLAVPATVAAELVPKLNVPDQFQAILNAHFLLAPPAKLPEMIGVVGGITEWIFAFPDRISVTVSAAERLADEDREELARRIWAEVVKVHGLPDALPPWQVVREKRATFAATPAQERKRPKAQTRWQNLVLAGDWTSTGLPATIEGTIRSADTAAALAMQAAA